MLVVVFVYVMRNGVHAFQQSGEEMMDTLIGNGSLFAAGTLLGTLGAVPLIVLIARARTGYSVRQYLALKPVRSWVFARWMAMFAVLLAALHLLPFLWRGEKSTEFGIQMYSGDPSVVLLLLGIVLAGPLLEEMFMRGFLFDGLHHSRAGAPGAILITALLWALIHVQYDLIDVGAIFVAGVFLGLARLKTGSIYPPLAMHVLWNTVAVGEGILMY
jgi:hypothetical protein